MLTVRVLSEAVFSLEHSERPSPFASDVRAISRPIEKWFKHFMISKPK